MVAAQYGVILDAGSSGTRLYIYKWKDPNQALKHASEVETHNLPKLMISKSKKIHPGVTSYAKNVKSVGPDYLKSLIDMAIEAIPASKIAKTPIFLLATAGVRFLPKNEQNALLKSICVYLQSNFDFYLPDCATHIQVISGETEGIFGWIAANYLLGSFDRFQDHAHGKGHRTYGFLDMGGASAQIAFAPNVTEAAKHANDLKLVRMRHLDGSPVEYRVFSATWLGFGANKARSRYIQRLREHNGGMDIEIPDPCLPKGLRTSLAGEPVAGHTSTHYAHNLVGTGVFSECLRTTRPLLGKDKPCNRQPCLLNGEHAPAIDFDVNHFIGVSEYWHTTHGVFGNEEKSFDLASYEASVMSFCNGDWASIENSMMTSRKITGHRAKHAREACFKASWLINILYEGIGIPQVNLDDNARSGSNATKALVQNVEEKGYLNPFQPVNTINGVEVSWTLGRMVLYAAGQVPPKGTPMPVGFGSNVQSGTPNDFELSGSFPLLPNANTNNDDTNNPSVLQIISGLMLLLLFVVIWYLVRKPECRRLASLARRRRRSDCGRKYYGNFSLARLFRGRMSISYDRVMEEGEANELELNVLDSDENDFADGADGPTVYKARSLATPKLKFSLERFDDLRPPSVIDRHGLVVRTESYERLAPTAQMLNAGRRSRAGSPTRLKSSVIAPLAMA